MFLNRRTFLQLLSAGALAGIFPESIARALAIPANRDARGRSTMWSTSCS